MLFNSSVPFSVLHMYVFNFAGVPRTAENEKAEEGGRVCNQKCFMNNVAAKIPSKWRLFGIGLGIDNDILNGVATRYQNESILCFADVYSKWEKKNRTPVTWTEVIEVLENDLLQERTLACELSQKYMYV